VGEGHTESEGADGVVPPDPVVHTPSPGQAERQHWSMGTQ